MTPRRRRSGRPSRAPASGSEAVDGVVLLLQKIRTDAGLSVERVHELLHASGELDEVPAKSTLARKLTGVGLKNERRLVEAIVTACVPDEQQADVLRTQAVERLKQAWSQDTAAAPPQPAASTENGDGHLAELVRVQRTLIEVQNQLAAALGSVVEAEQEATRLRALLSTTPIHRAAGSTTPADADETGHGDVGGGATALAARPAAAEAERDEAERATSSALHRPAAAKAGLATPGTSSAGLIPPGTDAPLVETGRSDRATVTRHPRSGTWQVGGRGSEGAEHIQEPEEDSALIEVHAEMLRLDPDGSRMGSVIDEAGRYLLDPAYTGRYRWSQLTRVERTSFGATVFHRMQRDFSLPDGQDSDFAVAGHEVDMRFTSLHHWILPEKAQGKLCLLVRADEDQGLWSLGLLRAIPETLRNGVNKDRMRGLSAQGRDAIRWIHRDLPLPEHALRHLPSDTIDAIRAKQSGQARIEELFLRAERTTLSSADLAAVTMQSDFARRARTARSNLARRGVLVLSGAFPRHVERFMDIGLPALKPHTWMSARLTPSTSAHENSPTIQLDGAPWRLARHGDPEVPLPPAAGLV